MKVKFLNLKTESSWNFVESHYKKYLNKFQEKKEKELLKKKRLEEEEEKKRIIASNEKSSASVKEITQEEYERRKLEEKMNSQKQSQITEEIISTETTKETAPVKEEASVDSGKLKPGPGNGGSTDKYVWTQHDIKEIGVTIPIPTNIKGRDVTFKYSAKDLLIQIRGQEPIIKGDFHQLIKADSLVWTIEEVKNGKIISITFEKSDTYKWWECLIKGDPIIDTSKINPEPSKLSDIEDKEMKATVEKMMFDTRQKQMGLPTSDELGKKNMLDKFMKAHPEMDFSKCKFDNL